MLSSPLPGRGSSCAAQRQLPGLCWFKRYRAAPSGPNRNEGLLQSGGKGGRNLIFVVEQQLHLSRHRSCAAGATPLLVPITHSPKCNQSPSSRHLTAQHCSKLVSAPACVSQRSSQTLQQPWGQEPGWEHSRETPGGSIQKCRGRWQVINGAKEQTWPRLR